MEIFAENQFIVGGIYRVVEHFVTHKNSLAQIKKFSPVRYKIDLLRVAEYSGVGLPGLVSDYPFRA